MKQEQKEENLRLKQELAQHQAQLNVCSELGHNIDEMSLSDLPRESPTESVRRYFNSLAADHKTADSLICTAENSQCSIPPTFIGDPLSEQVRTVQASTRLYTTITTTTTLISPAYYTVSKLSSSQHRHHDSNSTHSPGVFDVQASPTYVASPFIQPVAKSKLASQIIPNTVVSSMDYYNHVSSSEQPLLSQVSQIFISNPFYCS